MSAQAQVLYTKRGGLRRVLACDEQSIARLLRDPEVMRRTGFRRPQDDDAIARRFRDWLLRSGPSVGVWAGVRGDAESVGEGGELVGWFMLKETGEGWPELGFMVCREFHRQGFAVEFCEALLMRAQAQGVAKVVARCDEDNHASQRTLARLGFTWEPERSDAETRWYARELGVVR